jgi:hypothetical protein
VPGPAGRTGASTLLVEGSGVLVGESLSDASGASLSRRARTLDIVPFESGLTLGSICRLGPTTLGSVVATVDYYASPEPPRGK